MILFIDDQAAHQALFRHHDMLQDFPLNIEGKFINEAMNFGILETDDFLGFLMGYPIKLDSAGSDRFLFLTIINQDSGMLELLNLRLTQLRNIDGDLISIPNGSITLVKNKTSRWSRVNLGIQVSYDPDWANRIIEPPEVLGVDEFGDNGVIIRLWIHTEPGAQAAVSREFRRRIKLAFDQAGVIIPVPQRQVWLRSDAPPSPSG